MSKLRSMLAHSSVSSWWVPFSISCRCASSAVAAMGGGGGGARFDFAGGGGGGCWSRKPRLAGLVPSRAFSTPLSACSARMLMLLIISSRRLCRGAYAAWLVGLRHVRALPALSIPSIRCRTQAGITHDWRVPKMLSQELGF